MRKLHLGIIVASASCLMAGAVRAQYYYAVPAGAGPYLRGDVGPSFFPDGRLTQFGGPAGNSVSYDTGLAADAAIGYAFNPNFSADFEFGFLGAKIDSVPGFFSDNSRLYYVPFLANAILSLPLRHSNVIPYIGAGAGVAAAVFDTDGFGPSANNYVTGSESDAVPAGQIFAGVRFRLAPNVSLGVAYKFSATGAPSFNYPPDNFNVSFKGARASSVLFTFDVTF
jgi:opacity protein-like surface antigen